jgi:tetratricopeptide (TPR) repeat protein
VTKKLRTLLKIKERKEDEALRNVQLRRRALSEAEEDLLKAIEAERESLRTYPAREDAIYDSIMGVLVKQEKIDEMKSKLAALARQHQELVDDVTRMQQVVARRKSELAEAIEQYNKARRVKEKYVLILEKMATEALLAEDMREEGEVEELFAKAPKKLEASDVHVS